MPERKERTPPAIQALRATWVDAIEVRERERAVVQNMVSGPRMLSGYLVAAGRQVL